MSAGNSSLAPRAEATAALESAFAKILERALGSVGMGASEGAIEIEIRARVLLGHGRPRGRAEVRAVADPYEAELRAEGGVWSVSFAGKRAHFKDFRGFRFLRELLRSPARDIHVGDLLAAVDGEAPARGACAGLEMNDARARTEYRRRAAEIRDELEEATALQDLGRTAKLRVELDGISEELRCTTALGGRARKTASATERSRLNVTRSLARVIQAITRQNRVLGEHLARCVHTGAYCSYAPDPIRPIRWKT